jgi:hypothetical protein
MKMQDPRFPHGVREVHGTRDPREGRIVLHGAKEMKKKIYASSEKFVPKSNLLRKCTCQDTWASSLSEAATEKNRLACMFLLRRAI